MRMRVLALQNYSFRFHHSAALFMIPLINKSADLSLLGSSLRSEAFA
jgi:hypothetical protein